jgi:hypothetical protein
MSLVVAMLGCVLLLAVAPLAWAAQDREKPPQGREPDEPGEVEPAQIAA